jgi:hypothetical protein
VARRREILEIAAITGAVSLTGCLAQNDGTDAGGDEAGNKTNPGESNGSNPLSDSSGNSSEGDGSTEDPSDGNTTADQPKITDVTLETSDVSGGTELRLTVTAESNVEVDWLHIGLDGPNGSLYGGGQGTEFSETGSGVWETTWTYTVSDEAASGEYYFSRIRVENAANLASELWPEEPSVTIQTGSDPEKPELLDVTLDTVSVADGTELQLTVTAESNVPVNWLTIGLDGPNGSLYGGGQGTEFSETRSGVWETTWTYTVSDEAASGEYYFSRIRVENAANLASELWPEEPSVTIQTGSDPEKPELLDVTLDTVSVADGTELQLTVTAESNVTVDWLTIGLDGPNGSLYGGGQGTEFSETGSGVWETTWTYVVSDDAASGDYYFSRIRVENTANLASDLWPEEPSVTINNSKTTSLSGSSDAAKGR